MKFNKLVCHSSSFSQYFQIIKSKRLNKIVSLQVVVQMESKDMEKTLIILHDYLIDWILDVPVNTFSVMSGTSR